MNGSVIGGSVMYLGLQKRVRTPAMKLRPG